MMQLSQLLENCTLQGTRGSLDTEVSGLQFDSRRVVAGDLFCALRGQVSDGHAFIGGALANGAAALLVEQLPADDLPVPVVQVANARRALALAAATFYGDPTVTMPTVGVTGTNGKTTITYLLEAILAHAGLEPAVIGTINYRYGKECVAAPHTTPESLDLMKQVSDFRRAGARSLVMEVSSHALEQHRADGVHFDVGVFTNLTQEHLDYHRDMQSYFASKQLLFVELLPRDGGRAVINIDDDYGRRLASKLPEALTCGRSSAAVVRPRELSVSLAGIRGEVQTPQGVVALASPLLGGYNVENLLCAIGAASALGLDVEVISAGLAGAGGVPGRLERIDNDRGAVILVDYAHTGDALKRVVETMQDLAPQRILTVFGCGGDRDRGKRPVMAEVAARGSDITIATSDNPRTEDPAQILADLRVGLRKVHDREWSRREAETSSGRGYVVIQDRREALRFAVSLLRAGDLLLVAGKGHEDYQILGRERVHFDDREELRAALGGGAA
jgi:UDP-N-acetylmuramoyl-L-alanyl-D-glutamate--2,6-diaminopimelate ligase